MAHIELQIPGVSSFALCGISEARLHMTLAYLPDTRSFEDCYMVAELLARLRPLRPSTTGFVAGDIALFGPPEAPVRVRRVLCPNWVLDFRDYLVRVLDTKGVKVDLTYEPWQPHISIGGDGPWTRLMRMAETHFSVNAVSLVGGKQITRFDFPL